MKPTRIMARDAESDAVLEAAKLMLLAARTAPKTAGLDDLLALIVRGADKDAIADKMDEMAQVRKIEGFKRDSRNVRDSEAVILIGVRGKKGVGFDCGACGYEKCKELEETEPKRGKDFVGPTCIFKTLDLGIALGSAVKTASLLNVDNRMMYRAGTAALSLRLLPEATIAMGIPVSAKGKSIYFDRTK